MTTQMPESPRPKKFWTPTKANLAFILFLVLLSAPGVFMMVSKKLKSEGKPTFPPGVRHQLAYMDPTAGEGKAHLRVVPPVTGDWVGSIAHNRRQFAPELSLVVSGKEWKPIMGTNRSMQLLGFDQVDGRARAMVLIWDERALPISKQYEFTFKTDSQTLVAELDGMVGDGLPLNVRDELQNFGYIRPPTRAIWALFSAPTTEPVKSLAFRFTSTRANLEDELMLDQPVKLNLQSAE